MGHLTYSNQLILFYFINGLFSLRIIVWEKLCLVSKVSLLFSNDISRESGVISQSYFYLGWVLVVCGRRLVFRIRSETNYLTMVFSSVISLRGLFETWSMFRLCLLIFWPGICKLNWLQYSTLSLVEFLLLFFRDSKGSICYSFLSILRARITSFIEKFDGLFLYREARSLRLSWKSGPKHS